MSAPRILRNAGRVAAVAVLVFSLAACDRSSSGASSNGGGSTHSSEPPPGSPSSDSATDAFDMDAIAEAAPLEGAFPYFSIPDGYANPNQDIPIDDYGKIPFWTGTDLEWVEGTVYQSVIMAADGENFSSIELKKLVDDMITAVGGVQITDSKMSQQATPRSTTRPR